ncbi:MAG: DNA integrity scanning diadenylate cyclase DisA [Fervidobacterium sp.]|uniref:DNA integrity scanning diadenylate cyclase DisA n=1 Tax=Fervidobacterium sp. TaxID=1871331 RepID=UPI00404B382F
MPDYTEQTTQDILEKIKLLSPGTKLRRALDDIIHAQLGALIVFINEDEMKNSNVFQSGFRLDCPFTPEKLYELSKMDGAIVMDENATKILAANVHLVPDPSIPTSETGTRHRTAERVAKQLGKMVVAISKRRNVVTLYYRDRKHVFEDINFVLTKVGQTINALERFREAFDKDLEKLDEIEVEGRVPLEFICELLIRGVEINAISANIQTSIVELGNEGKLAQLRLREVLSDLDEIIKLLVMDYSKKEITEEEAVKITETIIKSEHRILNVSKALGYDLPNMQQLSELRVSPRGYRILRNEIHIPMNISQNVVKSFHSIDKLVKTNANVLQKVDGIGSKRAKAIVKRLREIKKRRV